MARTAPRKQFRGYPPPPKIPLEDLDPTVELGLTDVAAHQGESINAVQLKRARARKAAQEGRDWPSLAWVQRGKRLFVSVAELLRYRDAYERHPGVRRLRGQREDSPDAPILEAAD